MDLPEEEQMSTQPSDPQQRVLDVRGLRKPDKHPAIFARYEALEVGASFVLVNDHDPVHLHDEFESDHAGGYGWTYLRREPREWHIEIAKLARTPLPRVLVNTGEIPPDAPAGAAWSISVGRRDLDSNIISLPPGDAIGAHAGPDLDVLVHVVQGEGALVTERGESPLSTGDLVFLPRRSLRGFRAGPEGLRYLTVHRKRESLVLRAASD
jgi:uncharacterized protein (DUF2249 family)/quercetin dioxygenase-like cupin family protein